MLQELDAALRAKEEFLAVYTPIRETVETFLRAGKKIKGQNRVLFELNKWSNVFFGDDEHFPLGENRTYWKRETAIPSTQGPPVPVVVETERVLFEFTHYSGQVDKAMIRVAVGSGPEGRSAYLPPIWSLQQSTISPKDYEDFVKMRQMVSDVMPHLR